MDDAGIKFLDKLYGNLYMSEAVQHTKENKDSRIEAIRRYLERLEKLHEFATTEERKEYVLNMYFDKYIIKEENIPFGQDKEIVIEAQKKRLKAWIDYLTDPTTVYPMWAKYWAFQGMLKMGSFDETKEKYLTRNERTIEPFVEPNPEIIAKSIDTIIKLVNGEEPAEETEERLSKTDSFSRIYTVFEKKNKIEVFKSDPNDGIWVKYNQGSKEEAIKLAKSLENKNTHWCTSSEDTAISQVCGPYGSASEGGDFYVYYTKDKDGNYTIPRIAIRCNGHDSIDEIRGVEVGQNLEEGLDSILEKKLKEMTFMTKKSIEDALEKIEGLRELTRIGIKTDKGEPLSNEEIQVLYSKQFGFGWDQDPRQGKIVSKRNLLEDFKVLDEKKEAELYPRLPDRSIDDVNLLIRLFKINPDVRVFKVATERARNILGRTIEFVNFAFTTLKNGISCFKYFHKELQRRICSDEELLKKSISNSYENELIENMKYFPEDARTLMARKIVKDNKYGAFCLTIENAENKNYIEIMREIISQRYKNQGWFTEKYFELPEECFNYDFLLDLITQYDNIENESMTPSKFENCFINNKTKPLTDVLLEKYPERILEAIETLKPNPGTLSNILRSKVIVNILETKPEIVAEIAKKYPEVINSFPWRVHNELLDHPEVVKEAIKSDCYIALDFIYFSKTFKSFEKDVDQEILEQSKNDPLIPLIFSAYSKGYMFDFLNRNPSAKDIMQPELRRAIAYSDSYTVGKMLKSEIEKDPLAILSRINNPIFLSAYIKDCKDILPKECVDYLDDATNLEKKAAYYRLINDYKKKKKAQTI